MSRFAAVCALPLLSLALLGAGACKQDSTNPSNSDEDFTTPGTIQALEGDGQVVPAGQQPSPLRVIVWTPGGKKCNGCTVTWSLTPGQFVGGPVIGQTSVIGEAGLNLSGFGHGSYVVTAKLTNNSSVDFHFTVQ